MEPPEIHHEMERARLDFHQFAGQASPAARRRSSGTRWTNRQLLFHMVFGFIIVRSLMPLVHILGPLGLEPQICRCPQQRPAALPCDQLSGLGRRWPHPDPGQR